MNSNPIRAAAKDPGLANDNWPDSLPGQVVLALGIVIIYLLGYLGHPALPGNDSARCPGWWGWWDQGQYWKCAAAVATGHLNASTYWYPLGYPLLGAITWHAAPRHAFCAPDLLLAIAIALAFYRIGRRLLQPIETLLFIAAFIFFYRGVLSVGLVVPWNTIPTHFFAYACCLLLVFSQPTTLCIVSASALIGLSYLCRPADAICLLPMLAAAIVIQKTRRDRITAAALSAGVISIFVAAVVALNYSVFGSFWSAYDKVLRGIGVGSYPLAWKLHLLFLDGSPVFHETEPMLVNHYPWLLCCLPGIIIFVGRFGIGGLGLLTTIGATFILYLEYNDFWPSNVFRYQLVHYLVWALPLLALIAYAGLRDCWKLRVTRWSLLSIPAFLFVASGSNLVENRLPSIEVGSTRQSQIADTTAGRPDWVLFAGASKAPQMVSNGRPLILKRDFVDIPRADGFAVLFAPHVVMPVSLALDDSETSRIDCGQLKWRWHIDLIRIFAPFFRYFVPVKVVVVGKAGEFDEVGPDGAPDGKPDEVIDVYLPQFMANQIKIWDIQTADGHAHWISAPNSQGWWPIKAMPRQSECVRLFLPETGQMRPGLLFAVEARTAVGAVCLRATGKIP